MPLEMAAKNKPEDPTFSVTKLLAGISISPRVAVVVLPVPNLKRISVEPLLKTMSVSPQVLRCRLADVPETDKSAGCTDI